MEKNPSCQFFDLGAGREDGGSIAGRRGGRIFRNVEHGEFTFADFEIVSHVLNRILVREFADAEKCAAAVVIADGIAAFGIDMHVAEVNVPGVIKANGRGERRAGTRDAIAVIVGDGDVARPV